MAPNIQLIFRRMIKGYYLIITVFPLILTAARGERWMTWRYSTVWSETCFMRANCCLISEKLPINLLYISRAIFVFITVALLTCERLCNCFRVNQRRELRTRSALFPLQVVLLHELVFSSQFRSDKMEQHHIDFFFFVLHFLMFGCNILTLSFLAVSWEQKQSFHRSYLMSGFHLWSFLWNVFYFNRIVLLPSINNTIIIDFSTSPEVCADFLVLFL